jgi:penicillin-binding protein 1C
MGERLTGKIKAWLTPKNKNWRWLISILGISFLLVLISPLPAPVFQASYSSALFDRQGELLGASLADDEQWRFAPIDSVPYKFEKSLLLFEDEYFYWHPGINPASITRALYQNIRAGRVISGGSTLSMQTVRLAMGANDRTYWQKLKEALATLKLELTHSKKEILLAYTNHAPFGGNIVGLEAASYRYFGRAPHLLSWAESVLLAVLPNQPAAIFPGKNQQLLLAKRNRLLDKLHAKKLLSADELLLAKGESIPSKIRDLPNKAFHLLARANQEGQKGTRISTTIDSRLQQQASQIVNRQSNRLASNQIHNAAAVIISIETGQALTYVGNTNNPGDHGQFVDVITATRSPGSLLKPLLYASALDQGLIMPRQLLADIPLFYQGFAPKNFDKQYRGAVPANEALSSSLNVPFVNLLSDYGIEGFLQKLQQLGLTSLQQPASHYGLSMILGGAETSLWEISSVYASLVRAHQQYLLRPLNGGYHSSDYHPNTYLLNENFSIEKKGLKDGLLRFDALNQTFAAMQQLERPESQAGWEYFAQSRDIAWKTGTSFGFRDAWALGVNREYLVGVWVGNADGEGRPGLTGVQVAAPILFDLFELLPITSGLVTESGAPTPTCRESGMIIGPHCTDTLMLSLPDYLQNTRSCQYHQELLLDETGQYQVTSECYSVAAIVPEDWFVLPPVQAWYYQANHPQYRELPPLHPNCAEAGNASGLAWIYPHPGARLKIPVEQDGKVGRAIFEVSHPDRQALLYWHLDDTYLGTTQTTHQMAIVAATGPHIVTLVDESGKEMITRFEVVE